MKSHITFTLILLCFIVNLIAQEKTKDTLFFSIDKYYTISPTISPNISNQTYEQQMKSEKEQIMHTKTNGYVFFIGNGYLTKGLKPKKILSIKDYLENRKFYFDGVYNKIIDKRKLEDSLINKYKIYFVNGDEFIEPRYFKYNSYYPIGKGENAITNKIKDTLFFKLDNEYVYKSKNGSKDYLLKDSSRIFDGTFFFNKAQRVSDLNPKKVLSLKEFVQSSRFYDNNKQTKINDYELMEYLSQYVIFLVSENKKTEYIQVEPSCVIE